MLMCLCVITACNKSVGMIGKCNMSMQCDATNASARLSWQRRQCIAMCIQPIHLSTHRYLNNSVDVPHGDEGYSGSETNVELPSNFVSGLGLL